VSRSENLTLIFQANIIQRRFGLSSYYDEVTKMGLILITNSTTLDAIEIALLYKKRWQDPNVFCNHRLLLGAHYW